MRCIRLKGGLYEMAQVSILVKPQGMVSKMMGIGITPAWKVKKKLEEIDQVAVHIDDEIILLKASNKAHLIDVQPGNHIIAVTDVNARNKAVVGAALRGAGHLGLNLLGGGSILSTIAGSVDEGTQNLEKFKRNSDKLSCDSFVIEEGETISYSCHVNIQGVVILERIG